MTFNQLRRKERELEESLEDYKREKLKKEYDKEFGGSGD